MGTGMTMVNIAMITIGIVECYRLKCAQKDCTNYGESSSLSIFWQVLQYTFVGASGVFMYLGQLEFFNAQAPNELKSSGSTLCMTSITLENHVSSLLVTMVMKISIEDHMSRWIPGNLNRDHLDKH
ncbi:hypothetical protein PVL29_010929 [Vitis rotundifolia]|uniref:Uncharacterized protein n=1 Tax=Vitis rotundifolia TaxID=103349 RepID=A0AA39DSG6_VITRO|nr:hypothetical protein PVL29_010929 [Vitis rotundifolia]